MKQKMKKTLYLAALLVFGLMVCSCVQTRTLTVEIPEQAAKNLPDDIQSLTIVNRTVDGKYYDYPADSLQNMFYRKQFELDTVVYDLQAADTMLKVLGDLLFESGRYDIVIPDDRFLEINGGSTGSTMSWDEVSDLCERFNTNAVLSIDSYKTRIVTDARVESFYNPLTGGSFGVTLAQMRVDYEVLIRVYDPASRRVILNEIQNDSLFWADTYSSLQGLVDQFTPVKQALTEASIVVALDLSEKIATNWRAEQRNIFVKGKKEFDTSATMAFGGNWNEAVTVWEQIAESSKSKTQKSRAEFNIAVACELFGDIDGAIEWALRSYNSMYHPMTYEYLENLQRRKNTIDQQAK